MVISLCSTDGVVGVGLPNRSSIDKVVSRMLRSLGLFEISPLVVGESDSVPATIVASWEEEELTVGCTLLPNKSVSVNC